MDTAKRFKEFLFVAEFSRNSGGSAIKGTSFGSYAGSLHPGGAKNFIHFSFGLVENYKVRSTVQAVGAVRHEFKFGLTQYGSPVGLL